MALRVVLQFPKLEIFTALASGLLALNILTLYRPPFFLENALFDFESLSAAGN